MITPSYTSAFVSVESLRKDSMAVTEAPIFPVVPESEPPYAEEPQILSGAAAPKETKTMKVLAPRKRVPSAHPPYFEMIKEALETLKEKTGSSQYAITKFIEDRQKALPPNFRKLLLVQLKKLVSNGKLLKVKSSFKLSSGVPPRIKKTLAATLKPKTKTVATKEKKVAAAKKTNPKSEKSSKTKAAAKPKAVAPAKANVAQKRKKPERNQPPKTSKTSEKSTPAKKMTAVAKLKKASLPKKVGPTKKTPVKCVKPKTVRSAAKKVAVRRVKK